VSHLVAVAAAAALGVRWKGGSFTGVNDERGRRVVVEKERAIVWRVT